MGSANATLYSGREKEVSVVEEGRVSSADGRGWRDEGTRIRNWFTRGVETRGISPVPLDQRVDRPYTKIFFIWFSMNFNILSFSAGTLGPAVFNLGFRDTCLTILFFNFFCCAFPAYFCTWGPKLGMRQMIISRYSFGYYGVILPCVMNLIGMIGFSILNCILGGQALASVTDQHLSWTVGIVVVAMISLLVSFCGYNILNWYERIAWFPVLVTFIVSLGIGGKHLSDLPPTKPASAPAVMSFAATLAGFAITYSGLSSDFTCYFHRNVSSWKIFFAAYLGFFLPIVTIQCFGAAVVLAIPSVPDWQQGYSGGNIGGLLEAMLHPAGKFGKFLTVLLSLSVAPNIAASFYSISLNMQVFVPFLVIVPRYVFSILVTAIVLPVSIVGAHRFYETITNFLDLIGYWASSYAAILTLEHLLFRKNDPENYNTEIWNIPAKLPTGIAALAAGIASFGLVIPSMDQPWFVGSIARSTGDIGFEVAFVVSAVLYVPFRWSEIRWRGVV